MANPYEDPGNNKAERRARAAALNEQTNNVLNQYATNPSAGFSLYGTDQEAANQAANLSQVGVMTGQSLYDIGNRASQYDDLLQQRITGADPVSQYMQSQRNRNMANVARSFAGRGVAGGVAAASMNQAQTEADAAIQAQMYQNQKDTMDALNKQVQRNQYLTGNALSIGSDRGLANEMSTAAGSGVTLICTELKRQGLLPKEVQEADHNFGVALTKSEPETMAAYQSMATPIVKLMKKSSAFTRLVAFWAIPWAYHVAGKKNLVGQLVMSLGLPLCRLVGKIKPVTQEA